jgi:predicted membrane-bound spermidine synthase
MMRSIPPRLRVLVRTLAGSAVVAVVAVAAYGWGSLLRLGPVIVVGVVGYYVWSGRDSDSAAMLRRQVDERQAYRQLKIQALVGRVMSASAAVAYLAAFAAKATLWPFVIFLALFVVALLAGWVIYRERGDGQDDSPGSPDSWLTSRQ